MLKPKKTAPFYTVLTTTKKVQGTLIQTGTNTPVLSVLNNEIGTVIWARVSAGVYTVTWSGFADTINTIFLQNSNQFCIISAYDNSLGKLEIKTYDVNNGLVDDLLDGSYIEITAQQILS